MNFRPAVIRAYALGIITGAFLTAGLLKATPAHAAPSDIDGAAGAVAVVYGQIICDTLDSSVTTTTIEAIGSALHDEGLTWRQAGQAMVIAVHSYCPRHLPVLRAYAATSQAIA